MDNEERRGCSSERPNGWARGAAVMGRWGAGRHALLARLLALWKAAPEPLNQPPGRQPFRLAAPDNGTENHRVCSNLSLGACRNVQIAISSNGSGAARASCRPEPMEMLKSPRSSSHVQSRHAASGGNEMLRRRHDLPVAALQIGCRIRGARAACADNKATVQRAQAGRRRGSLARFFKIRTSGGHPGSNAH